MAYPGTSISSPLGSVDILDQYKTVLQRKFNSISSTLTHTGIYMYTHTLFHCTLL